jgi:putative addiction module component (TIGR02574 family)
MATTFASLGLDHLSEDDKWLLVLDLSDELEAGRKVWATMTEAQRDEIRRRVREADANPDAGIPLETVEAELAQRYGW